MELNNFSKTINYFKTSKYAIYNIESNEIEPPIFDSWAECENYIAENILPENYITIELVLPQLSIQVLEEQEKNSKSNYNDSRAAEYDEALKKGEI